MMPDNRSWWSFWIFFLLFFSLHLFHAFHVGVCNLLLFFPCLSLVFSSGFALPLVLKFCAHFIVDTITSCSGITIDYLMYKSILSFPFVS